MSVDTIEFTRQLMQITGPSDQFERMLDVMVLQIRQLLGVPQGADAEPDPLVEHEFAQLRQRLQAFRPEYESHYHAMFVKYLGTEALLASAAAISATPVQRYFAALKEMEPELVERLRELTQRMGETPVQAA